MQAPELLLEARHAAGLSQRQLAHAAATSQPAVARYETGAAEPTLRTLDRLPAACGRRLQIGTVPAPSRTAVTLSLARQRRNDLLALARGRGISHVRVFGSVARGEAHSESDLDLLVDLAPGRTAFDLIAFRRESSRLLGVQVDVATPQLLRPAVAEAAERDAVPV